MRIYRFSLAGLAALVGTTAAKEAAADDLTISTATTAPVVTSAAANGTPGDVTITSTGSIAVTANNSAVTVDFANDVSNAGALTSSGADNTRGIRLLGGFAGPLTVTSTGQITLDETFTPTDGDSDGDPDGLFAQGSNRIGILLEAGPTFTGAITNSGGMLIEGNNSSGIQLNALLTGNLSSTGPLNILGNDTTGVEISGGAAGGVTGNVRIAGTVQVRGANAVGALIDAPIGGALNINGLWTVSGYRSTTRPQIASILNALDADDLLQGGPAIAVHYSVGGGVTIEGTGVEDDTDDDGDGVTEAGGDTDDDATAAVRVFGEAPALLIQADPSADLVLGATASGHGVRIRGLLDAAGVYDGVDATALHIEGQGGRTVTTAGGVLNDNRVHAATVEADAYGAYIGTGATVPEFRNRGVLQSDVAAETVQSSYGLYITAGATLPSLTNTGSIASFLFGEVGSAAAITDLSNTLGVINNTGTIISRLVATDSDPNDDITPVATGPAYAIDLQTSTIAVTINQTADVVFTDDDAVDDDAAARPTPTITGDIRLGSGADTINLLAGAIRGDVSFDAGANAFNIDNGATYTGRLSNTGGLVIDVQDGVLDLQGGTTDITSATFGADSELRVLMSDAPGESTVINAAGDVTFAPGALVTPLIPNGLPASGTHTFLIAGGTLNGGTNVERVVTGAGAPFVYNLEVQISAGDPNALDAVFALKTAGELGLTANQSAAFLPIIVALRTEDEASAALASLETSDAFFDAYQDLMPSFSSAATELAATAIQQSQSAATNRLATTRLHGLDEVSVWAQEIGYQINREPPTANGQAYEGQGFGMALGIDGPLDNGALFGLAVSFVASEVQEDGRPDGEISASIGQVNAYLGAALGPLDLDFVAGLGAGQMRSRRFVEIGPTFSTVTEGEWWAYEGHGAIRASLPLRLADWFVITPQAALTYVAMQEEAFSESGGGDAIDYNVGDSTSQRLWGDAGLEFSTRFRMGAQGIIAPRVFVGYRSNLIDDPAEREFSFVSGGSTFTLEDDPYGDGAPLVGLGVDATNGYSTFSLSYEGEFGDQVDRHSVNAAVRFRF